MLLKAFGALALVSLAALPASATTFNFSGNGTGWSDSVSYSEDGIGLTVTAGRFSGSTITQNDYIDVFESNDFGLGVYNWELLFDDPEVDGFWHDDVLVFEFDQAVDLNSITFSLWDPATPCTPTRFGCSGGSDGDQFTLFSWDGFSWTNLGTEYTGNPYNFGGTTVEKFAIGAYDNTDKFKVYSLDITSGVPEPATWLMMIMGFGLVSLASRRRRTIAAA